jgi:hypothetical protein
MKKTDRTPSFLRAAHAYPAIVLALLTTPGCGPGVVSRARTIAG